jgi:SPP1 family predicted phage head-tail adaptor
MYNVGELDKRITIRRETRTADRIGGYDITLSTVATVWAHVRPKAGTESIRADRVEAKNMVLFVIRWRDDVLESDRITWDGVDYNIRAILRRGGRKLYLEIEAERGAAQ